MEKVDSKRCTRRLIEGGSVIAVRQVWVLDVPLLLCFCVIVVVADCCEREAG